MSSILYVSEAKQDLFYNKLLNTHNSGLEQAIDLSDLLDKLSAKHFALIIIKTELPKAGYQFLTTIRSTVTQNRFTPVIAIGPNRDSELLAYYEYEFTDRIREEVSESDFRKQLKIYTQDKPIFVQPDYFLQITTEKEQLTKLRDTLLSSFLQFDKQLMRAVLIKDYRLLREEIHSIEPVCSNLKLSDFLEKFQQIKIEQRVTATTEKLILEVRLSLLKVYGQVETMFEGAQRPS
jgi:CheY-like chemotaxis protein